MPTAHKVLVKAGESALYRTSDAAGTATSSTVLAVKTEEIEKKPEAVVSISIPDTAVKSEDTEKLKGKEEAEKKKSSVSWDERFSQLKQYKEQNGHCRVPKKYDANTQLGNWVSKQRQKYKKNKLLPKEIKSLEGIGFGWVLKKHEIVGWDERFKQLKEYKEQNRHCRVPWGYKANPQLGNWVSRQRRVYNKTQKGNLLPEQIKSLEGIGFEWELPEEWGRRS